MSQKKCDKTVQKLLQANRKVCAGYAALSATTSYKVNVDRKFAAGGDAHAPIMTAVQQAIELHTEGQVRLTGRDELAGEDLFYGIQLSSLCITLNTATEPSVLDQPSGPRPAMPPAPHRAEFPGS